MAKKYPKRPGRHWFDAKTKEDEEAIVKKLESAFSNGLNRSEAALVAGITKWSLLRYLEAKPAFRNKMKQLRLTPKVMAKQSLILSIKNGNVEDAKWYLQHRDPLFAPKQKNENKNTVDIKMSDFTPEELEAIKVFKEFTKNQRKKARRQINTEGQESK